MAKASASAVSKEWGRYSEVAQREPVAITSHGRESLYLLSAEEYHRLKALDTRQALPVHELSANQLRALETVSAPEQAKAFDNEIDD
jgi:PHD/YefM family antitoxin component YafN of YafNO toxin-antitoxin module